LIALRYNVLRERGKKGGKTLHFIYEKEEALAMLKAYALCQEIRTKKQVQMRLLRNQTPMEARLSCEGLGPLVISKANERDVGAQGLHRGSCFVALVRILARR
jgi:hypothetical protein